MINVVIRQHLAIWYTTISKAGEHERNYIRRRPMRKSATKDWIQTLQCFAICLRTPWSGRQPPTFVIFSLSPIPFPLKLRKAGNQTYVELPRTQTNRAYGAQRLCFPIGPIALRRRQAKVRNWICQTESTSEHRVPGFSKNKQRLVFQSFYSSKQSKASNHCFHSCHRQRQKSLGFDVVFLFQ